MEKDLDRFVTQVVNGREQAYMSFGLMGGGVQAQPGSQWCGREQRLLQVLQRGRGFGQIERRRAGKARVHQALGRKAAPGRLRPLQRLP